MMVTAAWSSHLPVLMKLISITQGPVLEMGTGIYSTPYLHWACFEKRKLISYENDQNYIRYNRGFRNDLHKIIFVDDWDKADIEKPWDIVLIDHEPSPRRITDIKRVANFAKYIVVHDTQPEIEPQFRYNEIYPLFESRYDFKKHPANTTILSNFIDLTNLVI